MTASSKVRQHQKTMEMPSAIVRRKSGQPRQSYIGAEAGQYSGGQQKEHLKTMLTVNRGTEIILVCYQIRMVTLETQTQAKQGCLMFSLPLSLTPMIGCGILRALIWRTMNAVLETAWKSQGMYRKSVRACTESQANGPSIIK